MQAKPKKKNREEKRAFDNLLPDATPHCSVYGMLGASVSKLLVRIIFAGTTCPSCSKKEKKKLVPVAPLKRPTLFRNKQMFTPKRAVLFIKFATCALGAGTGKDLPRNSNAQRLGGCTSASTPLRKKGTPSSRRPLSPVLPFSPRLFSSACSRRSPARPVPSCRAGSPGQQGQSKGRER